jgi:hypothetical protein
MKAAQVPKPGADFQIVDREMPDRARDTCGSRYRPVASAAVTFSQKKARGLEFSTRVFQDTR